MARSMFSGVSFQLSAEAKAGISKTAGRMVIEDLFKGSTSLANQDDTPRPSHLYFNTPNVRITNILADYVV